MSEATSINAAYERASPRIRCIGCSALVAGIDAPSHHYMIASPGCWKLYGQLAGDTLLLQHASHVDCYAVQHPDGAKLDDRQRRSVAVHLTALCLRLEYGVDDGLSRWRSKLSSTVLPRIGITDWPYLSPPENRGEVTIVDLDTTANPLRFAKLFANWSVSSWEAWEAHHDTVRGWASAALGSAS